MKLIISSYLLTIPFVLGAQSFNLDSLIPYAQSIYNQDGTGEYNFGSMPEDLLNSDLIGMGEASHGAHEFFQYKCEFIKYLIEFKGFRLFAIESTLGNTFEINDYILNSKGDPKVALSKLDNYYWNCNEVLDLVEWIHDFNTKANDQDLVKFYGFDVNSSYGPSSVIADYLAEMNPSDFGGKRDSLINLLMSKQKTDRTKRDELLKLVTFERSNYIKKSTVWEYEIILRSFENLNQINSVKYVSMNYRDSCMAENVQWLVENVSNKIILWAHNYHIADYTIGNEISMGHYLTKKYPDRYYKLGFDFSQGEVWAKKGGNILSIILHGNRNIRYSCTPPNPKHLTYSFSKIPIKDYFLNINTAVENCVQCKTRFREQNYIHETSAWASEKSEYVAYEVSKAFNGLVFFETVRPSDHLYLMESE